MSEGDKGPILKGSEVEPILAKLPKNWGSAELSDSDAQTLGIRGPTMAGACVSGVFPIEDASSLRMYGEDVVAGITVLRHELPERRQPNEPEGNADHYVVTMVAHEGNYFRLLGPFRLHEEFERHAGITHWHDFNAFSAFVNRLGVSGSLNAIPHEDTGTPQEEDPKTGTSETPPHRCNE